MKIRIRVLDDLERSDLWQELMGSLYSPQDVYRAFRECTGEIDPVNTGPLDTNTKEIRKSRRDSRPVKRLVSSVSVSKRYIEVP
jgi:hypothetical protein